MKHTAIINELPKEKILCSVPTGAVNGNDSDVGTRIFSKDIDGLETSPGEIFTVERND